MGTVKNKNWSNRHMNNSDFTLLNRKQHSFISESLPDDKLTARMADFFSLFSDPTRLKILSVLSISEMCVGDIAALLRLNQSTVSHQLKLLKDAGMVSNTRSGKFITYEVANPFIDEIMLTGVENCLKG